MKVLRQINFRWCVARRELTFLPGGGEGSPNPHFQASFPLFLISFQVVFLLGLKKVMKSLLNVGRVPVHS